MHESSVLLFICGWPACGAAHYGDYLAQRFGFRHLDVDPTADASDELRDGWEKATPGRMAAFAERLLKRHPRWVVTGPAPVDDLPRLAALQAAGFSLWFLLARSESLSRQRWLRLEREIDREVRPTDWEAQAQAIRSRARDLRPYFRDRCVETLNSALELMDDDAFVERIGLKAM